MEVREASAAYIVTAATPQAPVGYKQTEVGVVPVDWNIFQLCELGKFKNGINKGSEAFGHGSPFVNLMDVFGVSSIASSDSLGLVDTNNAEQQTYDLRKGDVIFIRSSVKPSGVGLTAVVEEDLPKTVYSGFLIRFRDDGTLSCGFKRHCFYEEGFRRRAIGASSVSANTNINQDNLKRLFLPLPPTKAEQEAIAEALNDADALIESLEQLLTKKRHLKQGAMQELLTGKKRLPGFSGEWEVKRLGDVVEINKGELITEKNAVPGPIPVIAGGKRPAYYHNCANRTGKTITVSGSGASAGYVAYYDIPIFASDCSTIGEGASYAVEFIYFALLLVQGAIYKAQTGGAQPHIHPSDLRPLTISVPATKEEQTAIATILSDMGAELAALEEKLAKARNLKQGMMQELLTGRIRLVQPASNVMPFPEKAQPALTITGSHNKPINEAVIIGVLSKHFGTENYPLPRKRRVKLTYLLHRYTAGKAEGYLKKAAGPYDPGTKYKGPETIALKNGYVREHHNGSFPGFVAGDKIVQAENYFEKWYGTDALAWLGQFKYKKTDELELLTTVDMAMVDLAGEGRMIDLLSVKAVIAGHPEWVPKLSREIFSDANIERAISVCEGLFG